MENFTELSKYAKAFSGLTPEREASLLAAGPDIKPHLPEITEQFYAHLLAVPSANRFLEGRVAALKATHLRWMEGLFSGPFDDSYTQAMYRVGAVHVQVKLPVEFMAGGMTILQQKLSDLVYLIYQDNPGQVQTLIKSINAVIGFTLIVMQQSYQASTIAEELDKFLKISGISRILFANLAKAYKD